MNARPIAVGAALWLAGTVSAQPAGPPATSEPTAQEASVPPPLPTPLAEDPLPAPEPAAPAEPAAPRSPSFPAIQVHGFVSEGGFISTANDYIGASSRGSLKFFEIGINGSLQLTDRLRFGIQFVSRSVGTLSEELPRLDWGFADYRFHRLLGLRAGAIKMPFGLYNEYIDIDASRTAILLPQSLYPLRNRDALISHTGFAAYGSVPIGPVGEIDYQVWLGTLAIPRSALIINGASLDSVDSKYVTGAQAFWHPPIPGLRVGATYFRALIDYNLTLNAGTVDQLVEAELVPSDYDGDLVVSQDPTSAWVASAEYVVGDWRFAAEYGRGNTDQRTSLPDVIPAMERNPESIYAMATYRLSRYFEIGTYYSVLHADADDRLGDGDEFSPSWQAFQRDLAGTLRIDVNEYWLWKLEAHLIDGVADLEDQRNPDPERTWGLFLFRTTVTF